MKFHQAFYPTSKIELGQPCDGWCGGCSRWVPPWSWLEGREISMATVREIHDAHFYTHHSISIVELNWQYWRIKRFTKRSPFMTFLLKSCVFGMRILCLFVEVYYFASLKAGWLTLRPNEPIMNQPVVPWRSWLKPFDSVEEIMITWWIFFAYLLRTFLQLHHVHGEYVIARLYCCWSTKTPIKPDGIFQHLVKRFGMPWQVCWTLKTHIPSTWYFWCFLEDKP